MTYSVAKPLSQDIPTILWEKKLMKKNQEINLLQFEIRILKETIELMAGRKRDV